jgi:hypothetical protein
MILSSLKCVKVVLNNNALKVLNFKVLPQNVKHGILSQGGLVWTEWQN